MAFVSYGFLVFLAAFVALYYVVPKQMQWKLLLAGSMLFYAASGVRYISYILVTGGSVYGVAVWMERSRVRGKREMLEKGLAGDEKKAYMARLRRRCKWMMLAGVLLNLGILLVVKYADFAISNCNRFLTLVGWEGKIGPIGLVLPLGISYYTLQALGYLLDVYHGKEAAEKNPMRLLLFLSFFPQVVQGPVSRFGQLKESLFRIHGWSWQRICSGMQRMMWGFFKKLVVADRIAPVVQAIGSNSQELGGAYVLVGMLAYTLQLYGDFTGGIDIAIGCARMFGVALPENFDRPFASEGLAEYWRRWHMTLMQWFREYVFYPLAGHGVPGWMARLGKRVGGRALTSRLPVYAASLVTWFLTGIWHGASWNFVAWGMVNCVILLISQELAPWYRWVHHHWGFTNTSAYRRFMCVRTLLLVSAVQMFEYYPSPGVAVRMFVHMFTSFQIGRLLDGTAAMLGVTMADAAILAVSVPLFCAVGWQKGRGGVQAWMAKRPEWARFALPFALFLAVLVFGAYGQGYDASQFIYNQF